MNKFRVWNKEEKTWVNPALFALIGSGSFLIFENGRWREAYSDIYEIQFFTGLPDKTKKRFFKAIF